MEVAVPELVRCTCTRINDPWRRFCGGCGATLAPACSSCGFVNSRHDRFCGGCGIHVATCEFLSADTVRAPKPARQPELFTMMTAGTERERPLSPIRRDTPRFAKAIDVKQAEPATIPLEILDDIQ